MSPLELMESADRLEIRSPLRAPMRVLLAALGLFPLLAPYELLLRIDWQSYLHPFFFPAGSVSAGAALVSAFFFFAAIAGLSSELMFDRRASVFGYAYRAPVVRRTLVLYPIAAACCIEVGERAWSDGAPSYSLRVILNHGKVIESGSSSSRAAIESIKGRVEAFIAGELESRSGTRAGA
jgi:hypothetical protein